MSFEILWRYIDGSHEVRIKYFGEPQNFIWPRIGEYVDVENPYGTEDIYGEVLGIFKRYDKDGRCEVEVIVENLSEEEMDLSDKSSRRI